MAVPEEDAGPGAGPVAVIVTVALLIVVLAIVFFGLSTLHWFGYNSPASVGTAPSVSPTASG
ncbi:MAG TPA: hypothetical protein VIT43_04680 [Candidatus Dormibacteraeota bacterium]